MKSIQIVVIVCLFFMCFFCLVVWTENHPPSPTKRFARHLDDCREMFGNDNGAVLRCAHSNKKSWEEIVNDEWRMTFCESPLHKDYAICNQPDKEYRNIEQIEKERAGGQVRERYLNELRQKQSQESGVPFLKETCPMCPSARDFSDAFRNAKPILRQE
jgi:hypothetical protein